MPNEQLVSYIRGEFAKGVDRTSVMRSLATAGWKVENINVALMSIDAASQKNVPPAPSVAVAPIQQEDSVPARGSSMKTLVQNMASGFFIACVFVLTIVSVLGVWKFFSGDVITKSFETLGLLAFVAAIVIIASRFIGDPSTVAMSSPAFRAIRNSTLAVFIVSSSLLALLGVLSIWEVITDKDVLIKSLSSLSIISFSSLLVVMVCLEREQNQLWKKRGGQISGGAILVGIFLVWLIIAMVR